MKNLEFPLNLCDRSSFRCFKMVLYTSLKDKTPLIVLWGANLHKVSVEHRFFNDLRWFFQDCCQFAGASYFLAFLLVDVTAEHN